MPRSERYTVYVEIFLNDGRYFKLKQVYPKGHPLNPYTKDDLYWKFKTLAGKVFDDESRIEKIIEAVENLEDLENVSYLTELLSTRR